MEDDLNFKFDNSELPLCNCEWCSLIDPLYQSLFKDLIKLRSEGKISEKDYQLFFIGLTALRTNHNMLFNENEDFLVLLKSKFQPGKN